MTANKSIKEYIKEYQPVTRKHVLKHFYPVLSRATVYLHVKKLVDAGEILDNNGQLVTSEYIPPTELKPWRTHPVMEKGEAVLPLMYLYAIGDERIIELARDLLTAEDKEWASELFINLHVLIQIAVMDFTLPVGRPPLRVSKEITFTEEEIQKSLDQFRNYFS